MHGSSSKTKSVEAICLNKTSLTHKHDVQSGGIADIRCVQNLLQLNMLNKNVLVTLLVNAPHDTLAYMCFHTYVR